MNAIAGRTRLKAYWELTKPGITRLVVVTTAAGFYLGSRGGLDLLLLGHTLWGTGLAAAGTNALNQVWERDIDARMRRTCRRPLPSGRVGTGEATGFASAISAAGIVYLALWVNLAAALVVTVSLVSYIFLYTPLKKRTPVALFVGAVPGALPILAGWVASGAPLVASAWVLLAILFLWQLPHFLSLGWIHREDYRRAGLAMPGTLESDARRMGVQATGWSAMLVVVSLLPTWLGLTGAVYLGVALVLGAGLLVYSGRMASSCTPRRAGRLFLASITYLPLLLLVMVVDKVPV